MAIDLHVKYSDTVLGVEPQLPPDYQGQPLHVIVEETESPPGADGALICAHAVKLFKKQKPFLRGKGSITYLVPRSLYDRFHMRIYVNRLDALGIEVRVLE